MVHFNGLFTHWVMSPILYYLWGRPRLTVPTFLLADRNLDQVFRIYCPVREKLDILIPLIEPSELRCRAERLLWELDNEIEGLGRESGELRTFWHSYGGIRSRSALTDGEIRRGLDLFQYWTEGDGWKRLAWAKSAATEEMLEICGMHLRHRQAGFFALRRDSLV